MKTRITKEKTYTELVDLLQNHLMSDYEDLKNRLREEYLEYRFTLKDIQTELYLDVEDIETAYERHLPLLYYFSIEEMPDGGMTAHTAVNSMCTSAEDDGVIWIEVNLTYARKVFLSTAEKELNSLYTTFLDLAKKDKENQ